MRIGEIEEWYNKQHAQATTNMKPDEAAIDEKEFDVKTNLEINAVLAKVF